jgi:hypothetical protein
MSGKLGDWHHAGSLKKPGPAFFISFNTKDFFGGLYIIPVIDQGCTVRDAMIQGKTNPSPPHERLELIFQFFSYLLLGPP